jgi:phosphopantothenoylcysteine decarboxylase/phosphopantothenate--cysteine ligase
MSFLLRNPTATIVSHQKQILFLTESQETSVLPVENAEQFCSLIQKTDRPIEKQALLQHISEKSLALLISEGVLLEGTRDDLLARIGPPPAKEKPCKRLVFGVSGAVSAASVQLFVIEALQNFCEEIDVVLTKNALRFVQPNTLLFPRVRVWSDAFSPQGEISVPHIHLADKADLVLILPASAGTIAKIATGLCSDLLSLVVSATQAPVVLAPAMNGVMWRNPAISRNVKQLRSDGLYVIEPSFAWEMYQGPNSDLELGGLGVSIHNLAQTLESVLIAHQDS